MPRNDLFRKQVLEARQESMSQFGRPAATVPPAWSWFILGLVVFFGVLFTFATLVDFSRKETVRGRLRHTQAEARIISERSGTVTEIFVKEQQRIAVGQPLVEIETDQYLRDGQRLSAIEQNQLDAEIAAVRERLLTAEQSASVVRRGLNQRQLSLESRLASSRSRYDTLQTRVQDAQTRYDQSKEFLEEGLIAQADVDVRQAEYNRVESELLGVEREINLDEGELSRLRVDIQQIDTNLASTQSDLTQQIVRLNGQKRDTASSAGRQIVASIDGVVTGLQVREGEPVAQGRLMLAIVPKDSQLFAELFLPSTAIAFVKAGQEVKLQYDALPYQKFGVGEGTVMSVSSTAFLSSDLGNVSESNELLYRVEVALGKQSVDAFGQAVPLQSGMELSADIVLEKRKVLDWAFSAFQRG